MSITNIYELLEQFAPYKEYVAIGAMIVGVVIIGVLVVVALIHLLQHMRQSHNEKDPDALKNTNFENLSEFEKASVLRKVIAPDYIDPAPNGYLLNNDAGKDIYIRSFTISSMPKRSSFANTYAELFDFPNCTSSVFVNPVDEGVMNIKMDRHITILASEFGAAYKDVNRSRKIKNEYNEAYAWAEELETGENKFFEVGFLFTLMADSLEELNKMSDSFRAKALGKTIMLSSCYAVQAEAYLANAPFNKEVVATSDKIAGDGICYYYMDKFSLSTLFNYTQSTFSHKDGVPIGRDMTTGDPVIYDLYDPSHEGFTILFAGKTRSGKSATIKMILGRGIPLGLRVVCVDSQSPKGTSEGEYSGICEVAGGINYQISRNSKHILNLFDVSETTKNVKDSFDTLCEVRTLELKEKIQMTVYQLSSMMQITRDYDTLKDAINVKSILTDTVAAIYEDKGIKDGIPDSLYEEDLRVDVDGVTAGKIRKKMPTMTDFYKKLLVSRKTNKNVSMGDAYDICVKAFREFVRELYYSAETVNFFTEEEYNRLPVKPGTGQKQWPNAHAYMEDVIAVHGSTAYYDGQSTVSINKDCPFTNIDISQLSENEKKLARQICIDYVNENFIKKSSETLDISNPLVVVLDEAQELYDDMNARLTLSNVARTAGKRHVAMILSTQNIIDCKKYEETENIFKQATAKFIFKQDYTDRNWLKPNLGITDAQADFIVNNLGGGKDDDDSKAHKGEVCIVDNKQVCFCKVDYLRENEELIVETDARNMQGLFKVNKAG